MAVIEPDITTDPAEIEQVGFDYMRSAIPGWAPSEADLATWLIRAHARMIAEERDVAADVPLGGILRPLGEQVHRIPPLAASAATVSATFTVADDAGYTIPAGLEVLVKTAGDQGVTFVVAAPVVIAPRRTSTAAGEVTLTAMAGYEGAQGNGLTSANTAVPIRSWSFIESVTLVGESAGGADAETDDAYLERLAGELALTSPIPILPDDFAALARRVPTVARALAINLDQAVPEIIEITYSGTGTATLTDRASSRSVSFASGDTAARIAAAFEALTVTPRYVATGSGGPLGTASVTITLRRRASYGPWQLTATAGQTVSVVSTQKGGETSQVPRAVAVVPVTSDGEPLGNDARAKVKALLESMREANWLISVVDPSYTPIDVVFEATTFPGYDGEAVHDAAVAALRGYLSPVTWGTQLLGQEAGWLDEPLVRYLEVAQVLQEVPGLRYVTRLQLGLEGGALGADDITLTGPGALPRPGAGIAGTVTEG